MIYVISKSFKPQFNIALEEYCFRALRHHDKVFMLWRNEPSIILGKFQNNSIETVKIHELLAGFFPYLDVAPEFDPVCLEAINLRFDIIDCKGDMTESELIGLAQFRVPPSDWREILDQFDLGSRSGQGKTNEFRVDMGKTGNKCELLSGKARANYFRETKLRKKGLRLLKIAYDDVDVVQALNALGVTPRDLIGIMQSINSTYEYFWDTIALWGLSFKPRTDDMREAPSVVIIERLLELGATVRAHDPVAIKEAARIFGGRVEFNSNPYEILQGADALAIVTEWSEYRNPDFDKIKSLLKQPTIFDGRNLYQPQRMREAGFRYLPIGRNGTLFFEG